MKKIKFYISAIISVFLFIATVSPITQVRASNTADSDMTYEEDAGACMVAHKNNQNTVKEKSENLLQSRAVGYDPIYTTKRIQIDRSDVKGYIEFCIVEHYNTVRGSWVLGNYYIASCSLKGYGDMNGANFGAEIKSSSIGIGSNTGSIITLSYRVFNYKNNMTFISNSVDINL